MEADLCAHLGARANIDTNDDAPTVYLPLMDHEGKILPVHFLQLSEVGTTTTSSRQCDCATFSREFARHFVKGQPMGNE